jgi:hypothetical protein
MCRPRIKNENGKAIGILEKLLVSASHAGYMFGSLTGANCMADIPFR